jgi:hypothetical protein
MKRLILIFAVLFIFSAKNQARDYYPNQGFNYFYSQLEPYGEWIQLDVDFYVWKPHTVGVNWRPYTNGRWHWTTHGWYWESFEPFGWATFHYGRWYFDDYYGWVWIPGNEWAPAWVEWRYNDAYIGWAPLPPYADFSLNIGIHFSINWRSSPAYWNFVRYRHFCGVTIVNYVVPHYYVENIYHRTRYRNNYAYRNGRIYNEGVNRNYVERHSGNRIRTRDISRSNTLRDTPGRHSNDHRLEVYAPSKSRINSAELERDVKVRKGDRKSSLDVNKVIRRDSRSETSRDKVRKWDGSRDREREIRKRPSRKDELRSRKPESTRKKEGLRRYFPSKPSEDNIQRRKIERRKDIERKIERNRDRKLREKVKRSPERKKRSVPNIQEDRRRKPQVKSKELKRNEPKSKSRSKSSKRSQRNRK